MIAALGFLKLAFGFFGSPLGRWVGIGLVAGAVLLGVRQSGYNAARAECERAAEQRKIEIQNKDAEIGEERRKAGEQLGREVSKVKEKHDAELKQLQADVDRAAKRQPALRNCPSPARAGISSDDIKRLR
jgi:hypothetical protein